MTNQEAIDAAAAAVSKAFPTLDVFTATPQDSEDQNDPAATLTVFDPARDQGWVFRCGRVRNWLWDADSDIVLAKEKAATLAVTTIRTLQKTPVPPQEKPYYW